MVKFSENILALKIDDHAISDQLRELVDSAEMVKRDLGFAIICQLEEEGLYDVNSGWLIAEPDFIDVLARIRVYIKRDLPAFNFPNGEDLPMD